MSRRERLFRKRPGHFDRREPCRQIVYVPIGKPLRDDAHDRVFPFAAFVAAKLFGQIGFDLPADMGRIRALA